MEAREKLLCVYCADREVRPGDLYCCDGCRVLSEISGPVFPLALETQTSQNDALIKSFGRKSSLSTAFECHVDPMACEACLQGLVRLEQLVPGLRHLQWNRQHSILSFEFGHGFEKPEQVFTLLKGLSLSPRWKVEGDQAHLSIERTARLRLGLTGALAANLMLFSVPIYAGLSGTLQNIFEWIQLFIFLPVFLWSALPFYRTAWVSIRFRQLSVDLPLVLAFISGSLFSIFSLITGGHEIYFDSLAGFLFLIIWSRSLLETSLARYLEAPPMGRFFDRSIFQVVRAGVSQLVSWQEIRVGDELSISAGDRLPVDGKLLSHSAQIEMAWMTGERIPHWRLKGSLIQAGSRLLSKEVVIDVTTTAMETTFAKLLSKIKGAGEKLMPNQEARIGSALVFACFISIGFLFFFGPSLGFTEVIQRSIAVLIVACPCAVSFAAPLSRAKANKLALKRGFWVRDPLIWDRIRQVKKLAFDKTGTLTGGAFTLSAHSPIIDRQWKQIILSLENISRHPIADSLRRMWGPQDLLEVSDAREVISKGVAGKINGVEYELHGVPDEQGRLRIELFQKGNRVVELLMDDSAPPNTKIAIEKLHQKFDLYLVSGDARERVRDFGTQLGFKKENLFGSLSAEEKSTVLDQIHPDIYFGDGTNDLPALKRAPVSIAVPNAALEAQASADILFLNTDFARIEELIEIANETRLLNRRNLSLALIYNLTAGAAALSGLINPLGAAILMPIASMCLLISTLLGTRGLRKIEKYV